MTFRAAFKLIWFGFEIGTSLVDYLFTTAFVSPKNRTIARAAWLHRACIRHIKIYS